MMPGMKVTHLDQTWTVVTMQTTFIAGWSGMPVAATLYTLTRGEGDEQTNLYVTAANESKMGVDKADYPHPTPIDALTATYGETEAAALLNEEPPL